MEKNLIDQQYIQLIGNYMSRQLIFKPLARRIDSDNIVHARRRSYKWFMWKKFSSDIYSDCYHVTSLCAQVLQNRPIIISLRHLFTYDMYNSHCWDRHKKRNLVASLYINFFLRCCHKEVLVVQISKQKEVLTVSTSNRKEVLVAGRDCGEKSR